MRAGVDEHAREFVAGAMARFGLGSDSFVVEVGSKDGYLLRHVVGRWIRCLGIEPCVETGKAARDQGVPTLTASLDPALGARIRATNGPADLVIANDTYLTAPDVPGFTTGLRALVADDGWISVEEPAEDGTVTAVRRALATGGLSVVEVEPLPVRGSARMWVRPDEAAPGPLTEVR